MENQDFYSSQKYLSAFTIVDGVVAAFDYTKIADTGITDIVLPDGIDVIGCTAFHGCDKITSVRIPEGVYIIGDCAFANCTQLQSVTIPNTLNACDMCVFEECPNLQYNEYENGLYLGNESNPYVLLVKGKNKEITSCEIHGKTKVMQNSVFSGYENLESVNILEGLERIEECAFEGCKRLKSVNIPKSVTKIKTKAFIECESLESALFANSEEWEKKEIEDYDFDDDEKIESSVLKDPQKAASLLTSDCKTWVCHKTFERETEEYAEETSLEVETEECVEEKEVETLPSPFTVENGVLTGFDYEKSDKSGVVRIPSGVTAIAPKTFFLNKEITRVELPEGVVSIGMGAFGGCANLEWALLAMSLKEIAPAAFYGCNKLLYVAFGNSSGWYADGVEIPEKQLSDVENAAKLIGADYVKATWTKQE